MDAQNGVYHKKIGSGCKSLLVIAISGSICALAMLPWLITRCQPQRLIPEELRKEPESYQQTVAFAQQATVDSGRQATSQSNIRTIRTLPVTLTEGESEITISTLTPSSLNHSSQAIEQEFISTPTPDLSICLLDEDEYIPATPSILVDISDILDQHQIMVQLLDDAEGSDFTDIEVFLTPIGIRVTSLIAPLPGITQEVEATGTFIVQQNSLRVVLSSITSDGVNVTEQYCKSLQIRLNTSFYNLLPERYVQDFVLDEGFITVYSKVRP